MTSANTRVLFLTRKYPPIVGGMEQLSADIAGILDDEYDLELVALRSGSNVALVWFVPYSVFRLLRAWFLRRPDVVIVGDVLLAVLLLPWSLLAADRSFVIAHGLDITFGAPGYRHLARWAMKSVSRTIANSSSTAAIAVQWGAPEDRVSILRLGVPVPDVQVDRSRAKDRVSAVLVRPIDGPLLLSLGRLQTRKGFVWFVTSVLERLPKDYRYVVAGDGPLLSELESIAAKLPPGRLEVLGRVSDDMREALFAAADVFVMPNIPIDSDIEGFGLVCAEAAVRGVPAVASDMEGIRDSVIEGATGTRVKAGDIDGFVSAIERAADGSSWSRSDVRTQGVAKLSLEVMARSLRKLLSNGR